MAIKVLNEFLPEAEQIRLGGVKVGETLSIDSSGILNTNSENIGIGGNRLTYVPRHFSYIKSTSSTLTVPSGGKVYIPNGFESNGTTPKFTTYTLNGDKTFNSGSLADGEYEAFLEKDGSSITPTLHPITNCISGAIAPSTAGSWAWYDTENNLMKVYDDTTLTGSENSLPLFKVTISEGIISVDYFMASAGYIGNTVFVLPNIHGIFPNGLESDTAMPYSTTFTTSRVLIAQAPNNPLSTLKFYINATTLTISDGHYYDGERNINAEIARRFVPLYSAETNGWVYCNSLGIIESFRSPFVESSEYKNYYDQTMPWNLTVGSYLNANKGRALVGQIAPQNGTYVPFLRHKSNNGVFLVNGHQDHFEVTWTNDSTIASNSNQVTHRVTLLNEAGNTNFPGNVSAGGTIQATASSAYWADLAEKYKTDAKYPIGTLIEFGGKEEITLAKKNANGVISEKPGYTLNAKSKGQPIALIGKTKVRVIGKVKKNDKLVLYKDGIAKAKKWYDIFKKPISIALEENNTLTEKLVMSVVHLVI